jgi:hypothetical protein
MPRDGSPPLEQLPRPHATHGEQEAEGLARSLSPVDLPDPPTPLPHGLKWATEVIAWAGLALALLNAHALRSWSYQLAPSPASARVVTAAEGWYDLVGRAGLNRPVEAMHEGWEAAREVRFDRAAPPAPDRRGSGGGSG